jgi:hypothetical protein
LYISAATDEEFWMAAITRTDVTKVFLRLL